jgi:uncharacterized protein YciI
MQFDALTVVTLIRPDDAPQLTEAEEDELQDQHMAFLADGHDRGEILAAGPLLEQDDPSVRGFTVYAKDPHTARELASRDPKVRAGVLAIRTQVWMVPAETVAFTPSRFPRSMREAGAPARARKRPLS